MKKEFVKLVNEIDAKKKSYYKDGQKYKKFWGGIEIIEKLTFY